MISIFFYFYFYFFQLNKPFKKFSFHSNAFNYMSNNKTIIYEELLKKNEGKKHYCYMN